MMLVDDGAAAVDVLLLIGELASLSTYLARRGTVDNVTRVTLSIACPALSWITIEALLTMFTVITSGVVSTVTLSRVPDAGTQGCVSMFITGALFTSLRSSGIAPAVLLTQVTLVAVSVALARVALTYAFSAVRVVVAPAINRAVGARPAQFAETHVIRGVTTAAVQAGYVTSAVASIYAVTDVTINTRAVVASRLISTSCERVAMMQLQGALIQIRARGVHVASFLRRGINDKRDDDSRAIGRGDISHFFIVYRCVDASVILE